jgi:hypothetical protein
MSKIGGSNRVREELAAAFAEGRGVTAKVRWVTKADEEGRNKWIHCTPLLGTNQQIGVWMVVIVNDEKGIRNNSGGGRTAPVVVERGRPTGKAMGVSGVNGNANGITGADGSDRASLAGESVTSLRI